MGRLCHRCAPGYGRSGQNGCAKCPDRVFNLLLISGGAIAAFLIMGFLIYTTRKSAKNDKDLMMMMIKIFMSYIQFVSLAVGLEIDWPPALVSLFRAQQGASSVTELFISFDCALASPDGDPSSTGQAASSGGIELFYQTQILYVSSPVVCGCVGVWVAPVTCVLFAPALLASQVLLLAVPGDWLHLRVLGWHVRVPAIHQEVRGATQRRPEEDHDGERHRVHAGAAFLHAPDADHAHVHDVRLHGP